jgi:hypothetical protein
MRFHLFLGITFVRFVIKSRVLTAKAKSVTLTFSRRVSEAGFGEQTDLLHFWFGGGSCFDVVSWSHFGVASFLSEVFFNSPCVLRLPLFLSEVFFLSPLHFGVTSFFAGGLFW